VPARAKATPLEKTDRKEIGVNDNRRTLHLLPELRAQIMFIEPRLGGLLIDVLCAPDEPHFGGTAVSLDVAIPLRAWAVLAVLTLDRWAALGSEVTLKFRDHQSVAQVSITDRHHALLLDLRRCPVGLSSNDRYDPSARDVGVKTT
jgi:hypothetical protein